VPPNEWYKNQCVPKCGLLQHHSDPNGVCVPNKVNIDCGFSGKDNYKGQCVDKCGLLQHHSDPNGVCVSNLKIPPGGVIQLDCAALGKDDYKGTLQG
jgi:hypothetical protein